MMQEKNSVLITGASGGVGEALMKTFQNDNWRTVGVDIGKQQGSDGNNAAFIEFDIARLVHDEGARKKLYDQVRKAAGDAPLRAVINNAAVQILGSTDELSSEDLMRSMNVNVVAPFALTKMFLPMLEANNGCVINIGSVHAQATKPRFAAYAASKAALHGLTRALAVDLGARIRVNTLAPAAVATPMLKASFEGRPDAFAELEQAHPSGRIAEPAEIARLALLLVSDGAGFINGATIYADGGILSRLHDPL